MQAGWKGTRAPTTPQQAEKKRPQQVEWLSLGNGMGMEIKDSGPPAWDPQARSDRPNILDPPASRDPCPRCSPGPPAIRCTPQPRHPRCLLTLTILYDLRGPLWPSPSRVPSWPPRSPAVPHDPLRSPVALTVLRGPHGPRDPPRSSAVPLALTMPRDSLRSPVALTIPASPRDSLRSLTIPRDPLRPQRCPGPARTHCCTRRRRSA